MNYQLAIVVVAVAVSIFYVVRHMVNEWRRTHNDGCNSCPVEKLRPPA